MPGSAGGFSTVLGQVAAIVSPTDAKRADQTKTGPGTATASAPATDPGSTNGAAAQVVAAAGAIAAAADTPAVSAEPSLIWAHIAAGTKGTPQAAASKPGAAPATGAASAAKDATAAADTDAAARASSISSPVPASPVPSSSLDNPLASSPVSSSAQVTPDTGLADTSPPETRATPTSGASLAIAPAPSGADDVASLGANPTSLTATTPVTLAAQQSAGVSVAAASPALVGAAVPTAPVSSTDRSAAAVPGAKAAAPAIAFWSPLKVLSNAPAPVPALSLAVASAATVAGSTGGTATAAAAHPASASGAPSTQAVAGTSVAGSTGTATGLQTEDPASKTLLTPSSSAGSLGLPISDASAAVADAVTPTALEASLGADTAASSPPGTRERGHADGVSAISTEPTATGFAELGETTAPGVSSPVASATPAPASFARDTAAPSVAEQVAPALAAMIQGRTINRALSVSITPDNLGSVSITVNRAADGTSVIQLGAERLSTLEMLHGSQAELGQYLDQAGVGHGSHSLSFTWNGADAGSNWAGAQSEQRDRQGEQRPAPFPSSMTDDALTRPQGVIADSDRVDVTA